MSINSINVKLPQLETVKLRYLHQGDVFMFPNTDNSYRPNTRVYMVVTRDRPFDNLCRCVCLYDGGLVKYNENTKVIRLKVTLECSYCSADDDDGLPF